MIKKYQTLLELCKFLTNETKITPKITFSEKEFLNMGRKINYFLEKKDFSIKAKMKILDNILVRIIYLKEKAILKNEKKEEIEEYQKIIEKFIDYPKIISKENNIDLVDLSEGINRLVLLMTHSCQLRCKYCSVRKFPAEIDKKTIKKAIDLLLTSKKEEVELQFFGGEPLLRFNLIKYAVEYANKTSNQKNKKIKFIITTNGIALTKEIINYLIENNFTIEFSFDGNRKTQLKYRKNISGKDYYVFLIKNLKNLEEKNAKYYIISVVTPENANNLFSNIKYLYEEGFKKIQINYALGKFWNAKNELILFNQFNQILTLFKKNKNKNLINILENRREPVVLNSEITVDCDGIIYLETGICLENDFNKLKKDFKIGKVNDLKNINNIFTTRAKNFYELVKAYSKEKPEFRKIILNNIEIGIKINKLIKEKNEKYTLN